MSILRSVPLFPFSLYIPPLFARFSPPLPHFSALPFFSSLPCPEYLLLLLPSHLTLIIFSSSNLPSLCLYLLTLLPLLLLLLLLLLLPPSFHSFIAHIPSPISPTSPSPPLSVVLESLIKWRLGSWLRISSVSAVCGRRGEDEAVY